MAIFRRLCLVGSTTLCFLLLNLTSEENIFCGKNWVGFF